MELTSSGASLVVSRAVLLSVVLFAGACSSGDSTGGAAGASGAPGAVDDGGGSGAGGATGGSTGGGGTGGGATDGGGGEGGGGATDGGGASGGAADGGGDAGASSADSGTDAGGWLTLTPGTSWQWQLSGTIDTSVDADVFDIDLFDTPQATIDALHAAGRKVICYFDTAYEPGRPDSAQLEPFRGNPVDGWPGQYWLDVRAPEVRAVMAARLDLAVTKRCDAVEPDDVDAIDNDPGLPLTAATQLDFCRFLANGAHARGLGVALKNDLDQIAELVDDFDFAINEECFQYDECGALAPFVNAGKAVLQVEYTGGELASKAAKVCPQANALDFDTLIKHLDLGAPRVACR